MSRSTPDRKLARRQIVVALRMVDAVGRARLEGLFRFLREGHPWDLHLVQSDAEFTPGFIRAAERTGVDGIIVSLTGSSRAMEFLAHSSIPVVAIDAGSTPPLSQRRQNITFITIDDAGIGTLGAEHLASLGSFRAFAFIHAVRPSVWSQRRGEAFHAALARMHLPATEYRSSPRASDLADRQALANWLVALPKPAAVMAADDVRATQILDVCPRAGIRVPSQLAVLGVDDDELLCDYTVPPLSSIQFVNEEQGLLAGRELDLLMNARRPRAAKTIPWMFKRVVERASAVPVAPAARLVNKALAFIARNALSGIGVDDVVRHLGVSRRLADLRFRELENRTILQAILDRRFGELERRLLETDLPIRRLAAACGFGDVVHLTRLFRKRHGMTMREFRQRCGKPLTSP